jgi:hypothetical protein
MKSVVLEKSRHGDLPGVAEKVQVSATKILLGGQMYRITYTPADGISRREFGGPCVPGPYAALFPLATVIDGGMIRDADPVVPAEFGDVVEMDGLKWRVVEDATRGWPKLQVIEN